MLALIKALLKLVTQKQAEEEEGRGGGGEAGSLQEKLKWSVEAGRLGGNPGDDREQLTVTQKHYYTLHTL